MARSASRLANIVLPEPLGPTITTTSPGATRSERLSARDDADAAFVHTLGPTTRFQLLHVEPGQTVGDAIHALAGQIPGLNPLHIALVPGAPRVTRG